MEGHMFNIIKSCYQEGWKRMGARIKEKKIIDNAIK